jgi:seryl-tRNA synthetase
VDGYEAFRVEVIDAGLLLPSDENGLFGRSDGFESIVEGFMAYITPAAADLSPIRVRFPPVIPRPLFEHSDYLRSFPNLIGSVHSFSGGNAEHAELLRRLDAGDDWSTDLTQAGVALTPAACYPLYPLSTGTLPEGGRVYDAMGWVYRHEPSIDPCRMQAFRQHEFVYLGEPDGAQQFRDLWIDRALELLSNVGLKVEAVVANDPFFGRAGRMLAVNQRQEALKFEIVCAVASEEEPTAITSCNCHRDHFGAPFSISTSSGEVAHTACIGFGLERIALALIKTHGTDLASWPAGVRASLWR